MTEDHDILIEVRTLVQTLLRRFDKAEENMLAIEARVRGLEDFRGRVRGYHAMIVICSAALGWLLTHFGALLFGKP